jgi:hypothetical protein
MCSAGHASRRAARLSFKSSGRGTTYKVIRGTGLPASHCLYIESIHNYVVEIKAEPSTTSNTRPRPTAPRAWHTGLQRGCGMQAAVVSISR